MVVVVVVVAVVFVGVMEVVIQFSCSSTNNSSNDPVVSLRTSFHSRRT